MPNLNTVKRVFRGFGRKSDFSGNPKSGKSEIGNPEIRKSEFGILAMASLDLSSESEFENKGDRYVIVVARIICLILHIK